ncbi:MAG: hypothetical protein IPN67_04045 [Bacteroidales bacterium]|nr:hypothetical protein [Bacteroidales bacterium]
MKQLKIVVLILAFFQFNIANSQGGHQLSLPDSLIVEAYEKASSQNVLAAVNPEVFFGYFSVCADGIGFGYACTYPSLDGHQMSDALLWLGKIDIVKANWEYVKKFQKENGELPLAILPDMAGKLIGPPGFQTSVDPNGGLYRHWVPGNPLRALAGVTYIQNADIIFRFTNDHTWLTTNLPSINLSGDNLASLVTKSGSVGGAGYYIERPVRIEYDGVSQCHAIDAFYRLASLNALTGDKKAERKYYELARLIEHNFRTSFWLKDHFAEYINPVHGKIDTHGRTDTDWSAIATMSATEEQIKMLWPELKDEKRFYYNGMPTGIATLPEKYEKWESTYNDNQDLAAMGRVWYLEAWARFNMNDADGLFETIRSVCKAGRDNGYFWRERYNSKGGYGAEKYNEYPANLIRVIQRFVLGVEHGPDGTLYLNPVAPEEFWQTGFGQTLTWQDSRISYIMKTGNIQGKLFRQAGMQIIRQIKNSRDKEKIPDYYKRIGR